MRWCSNSNNETSSSDSIEDAIKKNPNLAYYGYDSIQRCQNSLLRAGFTTENTFEVINGHPNILRFTPKQLEQRLEAWHVCNFTDTQFYSLFVQCPELLEFNDEAYIAKRYAELERYVSTSKNIWRLFMSSPNLLADDLKIIREKIDYILNVMEADETDLVKSGSLGLSIQKIKSRHMLLVRLGIYKKRNWKASEMDPNKNPRLFRIMDAGDKEFAARTCCGLPLQELEAFYELYERELEEKKKEAIEYEEGCDEESDYDTDDDDNEFDARVNEDFYDDRNRRKYQNYSKSKVKKVFRKKKI